MSIVISVEKLYKSYRLGQIGTGTLSRDLKVWIANLSGKPNPLSQIDQVDYGNRDGELIWALKDISFTVEKGEALGIIGRNGAGKSTLLKIISRVTAPTSGQVKVRGRIASLLEVGTGFHPELTGRENIYLNGAILGMTKNEVRNKFDEIVEFSELEQFIDTPVRRYSSGMYVRLAFGVAAHLEPEILLVDEVLAVGDLAFQKKCLGKMGDVAREGRTIFFVTHNMAAIQRLCKRSILIDKGCLVEDGLTINVMPKYLSRFSYLASGNEAISLEHLPREGIGGVRFISFHHKSTAEDLNYRATPGSPLEITVGIEAASPRSITSLSVYIQDDFGTVLVNLETMALEKIIYLNAGVNYVHISIDNLYLLPGSYNVGFWIANPPGEVYDYIKTGVNIEVVESNTNNVRVPGMVLCKYDVNVE
jgi:lipopolysaccharide transport system ATP-binding protein